MEQESFISGALKTISVDLATKLAGKAVDGFLAKARERLGRNRNSFARRLEKRVTELKEKELVSDEQVAAALENPDFIVLLEKAILSASRTDREDVHDLLSMLIAGCIQTPSRSVLSITCEMACEVIAHTTPNQLKILGLIMNVGYLLPDEEEKKKIMDAVQWQHKRIAPFIDIDLSTAELDCLHLESLSCVSISPLISVDLSRAFRARFNDFDFAAFQSTQLGHDLERIWKEVGLQKCTPTTIGRLLGTMVSNQSLGDTVEFAEGWLRGGESGF